LEDAPCSNGVDVDQTMQTMLDIGQSPLNSVGSTQFSAIPFVEEQTHHLIQAFSRNMNQQAKS
jgi:hypothetical protein